MLADAPSTTSTSNPGASSPHPFLPWEIIMTKFIVGAATGYFSVFALGFFLLNIASLQSLGSAAVYILLGLIAGVGLGVQIMSEA